MPRLHVRSVAFACLLFLTFGGPVAVGAGDDPEPRSSYQLQSAVMGAAGSTSSSPGFGHSGTLGQSTPIGVGSAAEQTLYAGFWKQLLVLLADVPDPPAEAFVNRLHQNSPNPFRSSTAIAYTVGDESPVLIEIYDPNGRRVRTLAQNERVPGKYRVFWDGQDDCGAPSPTGVYFYRITTNSFTSVRKMVILK